MYVHIPEGHTECWLRGSGLCDRRGIHRGLPLPSEFSNTCVTQNILMMGMLVHKKPSLEVHGEQLGVLVGRPRWLRDPCLKVRAEARAEGKGSGQPRPPTDLGCRGSVLSGPGPR